jgi:DNA-binding transcriptional LysR family regulator
MDWSDRIGRRVRLRDLHIVLAVAEAGSMAKASTRLSISHPVVSKAISELEQTLGVSLFDRSSRGVEPTPYGRALLQAAVNVFDEMRQGFKRIEFLADPTSAISPSVAPKSSRPVCCLRSRSIFCGSIPACN